VRTQPALKAPAVEVFQVQSGSFQISYAPMLLAPEAFTEAICLSTTESQSDQLTH
jgi:hypothetical protein